MKIVFRADASVEIGSGHVMRCLALATTLQERGAEVAFLCRELPGDLCNELERRGFAIHRLETSGGALLHGETDARQVRELFERSIGKADWIVVDHYGLDARWERAVHPAASKLLVIDDLANRQHVCDALLDQNYVSHFESRYSDLVPPECTLLLGPKYAMLRQEFVSERALLVQRGKQVGRILVTFGGSDPTDESAKCLEALRRLDRSSIGIDLVVGASNPHRERLKAQCVDMPNVKLHIGISYMAKLIAAADLAMCAGGTTTWERFCLGLPGIVITVADNQVEVAQMTHRAGIDDYLGPSHLVTAGMMEDKLRFYLDHPNGLIDSSLKAMKLVDGQGLERVAQYLLEEGH